MLFSVSIVYVFISLFLGRRVGGDIFITPVGGTSKWILRAREKT
jgi:hypothetical protein